MQIFTSHNQTVSHLLSEPPQPQVQVSPPSHSGRSLRRTRCYCFPIENHGISPFCASEKQKFLENEIPNKAAASLPESALYGQLLEFKSRLDSLLSRNKIQIAASLKNPLRIQKILRIYVFNTFANQEEANTDRKSADPLGRSRYVGG